MNNPATEVQDAPTTKEERFFGVATTIGDADAKDAPEIEIEGEPPKPADPPKADPPKPERPAQAQKKHEEDDPELQQMSEKVQKRIAKMRWQQGEVERERDAVKAERDEAYRVAQTLHGQNQQFQQVINTGEAKLVNEIKQRAANDLAIAKQAYSEAYEKGDTQKIIEAQEAMLNATADVRAAGQYDADYQQRNAQFAARQAAPQQAPVQPQTQPQVPSVPAPSDEAKTWAEENTWFGDARHPDMTALAYGIHERLVKTDGVKPDTPQYFDTINKEMRQHFPDYPGFVKDDGEGTSVSTSQAQPTTVVASGQRESAAAPRKVKLTATQVRVAKRLGISVEQYAKQLIKEGN